MSGDGARHAMVHCPLCGAGLTAHCVEFEEEGLVLWEVSLPNHPCLELFEPYFGVDEVLMEAAILVIDGSALTEETGT